MTEETDSELFRIVRELDKLERSDSNGERGFEYLGSDNGMAIVQYWESDGVGLRNVYSPVTIDLKGNVDFYRKPFYENRTLIPLVKEKLGRLMKR